MLKEGILWSKGPDNRVICRACARMCSIPEGSKGFCFVRENINGKLYSMTYGNISAMQIDPIEKKPFNHFMPGSWVLGVGTNSCNFNCSFCQNHTISKDKDIIDNFISPENLVELAIRSKVDGIAFTYNEPTIFIEYALDVAELAHKKGLFNVFVSNGYMTKDAIDSLKGKIDAIVVDFKGNGNKKFSNKYESVMSNDPIKDSLLEIKKSGIHLEITDLIIPKVGDSLEDADQLTRWIHDNLGDSTPIQFTRFYPEYKMIDSEPTPISTLENHYNIAKKNGLKYVYIGNIGSSKYETTYCPNCGNPVIERDDYSVKSYGLNPNSECAFCGYKIPLVGKYIRNMNHKFI